MNRLSLLTKDRRCSKSDNSKIEKQDLTNINKDKKVVEEEAEVIYRSFHRIYHVWLISLARQVQNIQNMQEVIETLYERKRIARLLATE